jgi:hypothetical protein
MKNKKIRKDGNQNDRKLDTIPLQNDKVFSDNKDQNTKQRPKIRQQVLKKQSLKMLIPKALECL